MKTVGVVDAENYHADSEHIAAHTGGRQRIDMNEEREKREIADEIIWRMQLNAVRSKVKALQDMLNKRMEAKEQGGPGSTSGDGRN